MTTRSAARFAAVTALCAGTMLFAACADSGAGTATTSAAPVSAAAAPPSTETPQERSLRIRNQLVQLGCDSNSCIQTYFACEDGLLAGESCDFYRRHPLN